MTLSTQTLSSSFTWTISAPAALLWDMDGTLIDSEPHWWAAERELVTSGGGTWTDEQALELVGSDLHAASLVLQKAGCPLTSEEIIAFLNKTVGDKIAAEVPWRDQGHETLLRMRDLGLTNALVTMSHKPVARGLLEAVGPDLFDAVITGDIVSKGKPDPEPYLAAARALEVDITQCIAIEDSPTGIASAYASGAKTIGIQAITAVPVLPGLSRVMDLAQITPALLDIVMNGGTVDYVGDYQGPLA